MYAALEQNGLKIMLLLRLSPLIPFNALDYIAGVTSVSLRDYALALIAILPGTIMFCLVGATASSLTDTTTSSENLIARRVSLIGGLLFAIMGVAAASYYSKMELDKVGHDLFAAVPVICSRVNGLTSRCCLASRLQAGQVMAATCKLIAWMKQSYEPEAAVD